MLTLNEIEKLAVEIEQETETFCHDCRLEVDEQLLDELTDDEFCEEYCSHCEMVVVYDPEYPENYSIDHYQYLTRITGMVTLPIPITKEEVMENLLAYEELTDKQKEAYSQRATPWDFRYMEE